MTTRESLQQLFSKVAKKLDWPNYEVSSDIDHETGNGFSGDFFLASITNKDTKEKIELAVKKSVDVVAKREQFNVSKLYETEICFYDKFLPTLLQFKESKNVREPLDIFANCLLCWQTDNEDILVMKNLKLEGYDIIGRENYLDAEHVEFIFKTYGKFHALSFAFKDQKPEEYRKLTDGIYDSIKFFSKDEKTMKMIEQSIRSAFECVDKKIQEKFGKYVEDTEAVFLEALHYTGGYSCLVHGDCWSNNMMFKYDGSKVVNMKLIDFQGTKNDTPVHDLSYFLYAGGSKEIFDSLDKYLELYYENFSKMCRDLGSDPKKLYPFEALKEDWRKYSKYGFIMGVMLNKMKMSDQNAIQDLTKEADFFEGIQKLKASDKRLDEYKEKSRDLVEHVYSRGFL